MCSSCFSLTNPLFTVLRVCCFHNIFLKGSFPEWRGHKTYYQGLYRKVYSRNLWMTCGRKSRLAKYSVSVASLVVKRQPCNSDAQAKITFRAMRNQNPQRQQLNKEIDIDIDMDIYIYRFRKTAFSSFQGNCD